MADPAVQVTVAFLDSTSPIERNTSMTQFNRPQVTYSHNLTVLSPEDVKIDLLSGLQETANWNVIDSTALHIIEINARCSLYADCP